MQVLLLHPFYRWDTEKPHERRDAPLTPHPRASVPSSRKWENESGSVCLLLWMGPKR